MEEERCLLCGLLLPNAALAVMERTNKTGPMRTGSCLGHVCTRHSVADLLARRIGVTLSRQA